MSDIKKLNIKKGDTVRILTGNDKGKTGKVLEILTNKYRAIVEGMNMVTKHVKPSADKPEGGLISTEAGLHISNLMLVEPSSGKPTRVGRKLNADGKNQRYSKNSGEFI